MNENEEFEFRLRMEKEAQATAAPSTLGTSILNVASSLTPNPKETIKSMGEFAKPAILPTVGSMAGRAAGTAFPVAGPLSPMIFGGVGSGIGEGVNQLTGITEPSAGNIALATGFPMALEGAGNLIRTGANFFPTSRGAELLNRLAPKEAMGKIASLRSGQSAKQLFEQATKEGVTIPLNATGKTILEIEQGLKDATPAARSAWQSVMNKTGLREKFNKQGGVLNPAEMQNILADIGKLQSQASREGGLKAAQFGKLFSSLSDDLENSGAKLLGARQLFKRETVLNEIDDAIESAFKVKPKQGAAAQFDAHKVINTLEDTNGRIGKFFAQSFSKSEQKDMLDLFKLLNEIPALKPPTSANYGAGKILRDIAVAGGIGSAISPGLGTAAGAVIGAVAHPTYETLEMMLLASKMQGGKQLLRQLLTNSDGKLTPQVLGTLGSFVSGKFSTQTPSGVLERPTTQLQPMPLER